MGQQDLYDRILRSLHEVAFDATGWPEAAGLIDAACDLKGNGLVFSGGRTQQDVEFYFSQFCFRGQRREDFERLYLRDYFPRDEKIPRVRQLPENLLVHSTELYTEAERKKSATFNEAMRLTSTQDTLYVRLDGPGGTHMVWALGDPVHAGGWRTDQTRMIERLLQHVRQFVLFRHALNEAGALGQSLAGLLDVAGSGVIHLDRRGRIVAASDRAVKLLRQGDGLSDRDGVLRAAAPADDVKLQQLLERASPLFGQGAAGSMTVGRQFVLPRLVLHVSPVGGRLTDLRRGRVASVVLVVDPSRELRIDADALASALDLTPTESSIAAMLATGSSLREIAAAMGRKQGTIRWHLKQIFAKHRISRQADVVRLVLSVLGVTISRR